MTDEPAALPAPYEKALAAPDFPVGRVARLLGIDPASAEVVLHDEERTRSAISAASRAFLEADDDRRAGRTPRSAIALDPDFPTGTGMALLGAATLWEHREFIPRIALRIAKDHFENREDSLAASFLGLVQESVDPGGDDASAWAAQSLLMQIMQRSGDPARADEIARDLAAHGVPLDLWRDDDPALPDDSMAWHGGAFVGGIPPRRDERHLSFEDVHDYLEQLLTGMRREQEAEEDDGNL
jgi:hypothetical protein